MVLQGVGVHRHHATVRFINGVFFVEGVGTNGIAINDPERVLPRNEPYPLKAGDKVFIDEYELVVSTSSAPPAAAAAPARPASPPVAAPIAPVVEEDLDPLRKLIGGTPPAARPPRVPDASWNHTSSLSDHFAPPPPAAAPAARGGPNEIPENWDRTSFDRSKLQPPAPVRAPAPTPAQKPAPRAATPPPGQAPFDWDGFLRAVGVDPSRVPPETAADLGNVLRSVVQGLIEVLRARTEIKTEFRMPVTQVK